MKEVRETSKFLMITKTIKIYAVIFENMQLFYKIYKNMQLCNYSIIFIVSY